MIDSQIEQILQKNIFPDLLKGRPDWDLPHTKAVVYWTKQILSETSLDPLVLITAAYAHDWGYIGLFPHGASYEQIQKMKPKHMERGAGMIRDLLMSSAQGLRRCAQPNRGSANEAEMSVGLNSYFTQEQIDRIVHLVSVHDKLSMLKAEDEILLAEADTLGALDISRVKPTFDKADNQRYLAELEKRRRPLFVHNKAIEAYNQLISNRQKLF